MYKAHACHYKRMHQHTLTHNVPQLDWQHTHTHTHHDNKAAPTLTCRMMDPSVCTTSAACSALW